MNILQDELVVKQKSNSKNELQTDDDDRNKITAEIGLLLVECLLDSLNI